jgi:hypothetical protein
MKQKLGIGVLLLFMACACARKNTSHSSMLEDSAKTKSSKTKTSWKSSLYAAPKMAFWLQPLQVNPFKAAVQFDYEIKEYRTNSFVSATYSDSVSLSSNTVSPYFSLGFELGNKKGVYFQALYSATGFRNTKQEFGVGYNGWQSKSKRWSFRPYAGLQLTRNRFRFNSFINNHRRDIRFQGELFEHITYTPTIRDILMGSFLNLSYSERLWPQLQHTSVGILALGNLRYNIRKSMFVSLGAGYNFPVFETLRFRLRSNGNAHTIKLDNPGIQYSDNINGNSRSAITSRGVVMMLDFGVVF